MKLKFRLWDIYNQKMYTNNELIIWNGYVYANDGKELSCNYLNGWSVDESYLMHSTGLLDKDSKEVFDGDFLAIEIDGEVLYVKVYWNEQLAMFMFKSPKYGDNLPLAELTSATAYPFAVVGNIYETPHLLEV